MSNAFRFNLPASVKPSTKTTLLKKQKPHPKPGMVPIGSDASSITDDIGTRSIYAYEDHSENRFVTLTRKESDLIALANPGKRPPQVLEQIYPWLPSQQFRDNSELNYRTLKLILNRYEKHLITPGEFCGQKWNTICNSVRRKTEHDARFFLAWHLPIQDAYVLEETRPDRRVVALDYNSMYASCMQQGFPKPSTMVQVSLNRDAVDGEALLCGLYRCVLHPPASEFIRRYNPFRTFFAGRYLAAALEEPLTLDLNEFEVEFFLRHFTRIELVDAVVSEQCISHPLARDVRRSYARRRHYIAHGNKALADREKLMMTYLSTAAQRPRMLRHNFSSWAVAKEHLRDTYGLIQEDASLECISTRWLDGRKGIRVQNTPEFTIIQAPDLFGGSACFEFNQRIVARSRTILLGMMERITQAASDVEICYTNMDSIHFSLPAVDLKSTLKFLRSQANDQLGSFKIEAVTRCGLWLEPGRYWLFSKTVERFRNHGIGVKRGPFADHSINVSVRKIGDLFIPIRMNIGMDRSMSDARTIVDSSDSNFARQRLVEVGERSALTDILKRLERNRSTSIPRRIQKFRHLQEQNGSCGDSLPRDPAS